MKEVRFSSQPTHCSGSLPEFSKLYHTVLPSAFFLSIILWIPLCVNRCSTPSTLLIVP